MINLVLAALEPAVQSAAVTALGTVLVALVGVAIEMLRRSHKRLGAVTDQVQNTHQTNLRDDVDSVLAALERIEATQRQHGHDIGGLRQEIRQERTERADLERRVDRLAADPS